MIPVQNMRSAGAILRDLLAVLEAKQMPPARLIAEARAQVDASDRARAEMKAAVETPVSDAEITSGILSGGLHIRLTAPQWRELTKLAAGPQPTYGKARVAVQRRLLDMTAARYVDEQMDRCEITDAGRRVLADNTRDGAWCPWGGQS